MENEHLNNVGKFRCDDHIQVSAAHAFWLSDHCVCCLPRLLLHLQSRALRTLAHSRAAPRAAQVGSPSIPQCGGEDCAWSVQLQQQLIN